MDPMKLYVKDRAAIVTGRVLVDKVWYCYW
jgi:hypothetical protein